MVKGIPDIYDKTCLDLGGSPFIEWIFDNPVGFVPGQFCSTVVWYVKRKRWYLEEHKYKPDDEPNSTWFVRELHKDFPPSNTSFVMKFFELEKDERLITTNSKIRPVILLSRKLSDWWNPINVSRHVPYWLCLPLFSYKERHSQEYVLKHQRLLDPAVFYIPSHYSSNPGINAESAARFHALQMVTEDQLVPLKCYCSLENKKMSLPFKLSPLGLRLVLYHFYKGLDIFPELNDSEAEYALFKEQINTLIDNALA